MEKHIRRLRIALRVNAAFSTACALLFLLGAGALAEPVGTTTADLRQTGAGLVGFVALLWLVAARPGLARGWPFALAVLVAALDVLWVVGTPGRVGSYAPAGRLLFAGVAVVVAGVAAAQVRALVGIVRLRRGERPAAT